MVDVCISCNFVPLYFTESLDVEGQDIELGCWCARRGLRGEGRVAFACVRVTRVLVSLGFWLSFHQGGWRYQLLWSGSWVWREVVRLGIFLKDLLRGTHLCSWGVLGLMGLPRQGLGGREGLLRRATTKGGEELVGQFQANLTDSSSGGIKIDGSLEIRVACMEANHCAV